MGVGTLILNPLCRKNAKGAWDPRNHCFMDTHDVTIGKKITVPAR